MTTARLLSPDTNLTVVFRRDGGGAEHGAQTRGAQRVRQVEEGERAGAGAAAARSGEGAAGGGGGAAEADARRGGGEGAADPQVQEPAHQAERRTAHQPQDAQLLDEAENALLTQPLAASERNELRFATNGRYFSSSLS